MAGPLTKKTNRQASEAQKKKAIKDYEAYAKRKVTALNRKTKAIEVASKRKLSETGAYSESTYKKAIADPAFMSDPGLRRQLMSLDKQYRAELSSFRSQIAVAHNAAMKDLKNRKGKLRAFGFSVAVASVGPLASILKPSTEDNLKKEYERSRKIVVCHRYKQWKKMTGKK